jgi:hypothetical protein
MQKSESLQEQEVLTLTDEQIIVEQLNVTNSTSNTVASADDGGGHDGDSDD